MRCVLSSVCTLLHSSLLVDSRGTPTDSRGTPPHMRCVLAPCGTLLYIHVSVTVVSRYPCSGFSNTVFSIQEYCIKNFRGLCIKGVLRVRSIEIPLSRIQKFMNISLSDNIRYYNQSSIVVSMSVVRCQDSIQYQCHVFSISSNISIIQYYASSISG